MQGNAKAGPPAANSTAGQKRPASEEGEVVEPAPASGPAQGPRNLKRPKKDEGGPGAGSGNTVGAASQAGGTDNSGASGGAASGGDSSNA